MDVRERRKERARERRATRIRQYRFGLPWKIFEAQANSQLRQKFFRSIRDVGRLVSSGCFRARRVD